MAGCRECGRRCGGCRDDQVACRFGDWVGRVGGGGGGGGLRSKFWLAHLIGGRAARAPRSKIPSSKSYFIFAGRRCGYFGRRIVRQWEC